MFFKTPNIKIEKIGNVEINPHYHPIFEKIAYDTFQKFIEKENKLHQVQSLSDQKVKKTKFLKTIDLLGKIISIISGIAIVVFVIFLLAGKTSIGSVQVSTLLTVISFTLIGGIISIGGVQMFSFNASLRKSENKIREHLNRNLECPFDRILKTDNPNWHNRQPGNPDFCMRCPLGIDISGNVEGGLIHVCKVYMNYHKRWLDNKQ